MCCTTSTTLRNNNFVSHECCTSCWSRHDYESGAWLFANKVVGVTFWCTWNLQNNRRWTLVTWWIYLWFWSCCSFRTNMLLGIRRFCFVIDVSTSIAYNIILGSIYHKFFIEDFPNSLYITFFCDFLDSFFFLHKTHA